MIKEEVSVDIWGSCVSRDSLCIGGNDVGFKINKYFLSCNPIVQFSNHFFEVRDSDFTNKSKFIRRMRCSDWNKDVPEQLMSSTSKWIIIDVRSMIYGVKKVVFNDGSFELISGDKIDEKLEPLKNKGINYQVLDQDLNLFKNELNMYFKFIKKRYGSNIILIDVFECFDYINKNGNICSFDTNEIHLNLKNIKIELNFLELFSKELNCIRVKFPMNNLCDEYHKWGKYPVHYIYEYYRYVYESIRIITTGKTQNKIKLLEHQWFSFSNFVIDIRGRHCTSAHNLVKRLETFYKDKSKNPTTQKLLFEDFNTICDNSEWQDVSEIGACHQIVGRLYHEGRGLEKDFQKAAYHMRIAADAGVSWAHFELMDVLRKINSEESIKELYERATNLANCGNKDGMIWLSRCYRDGKAVEKDLDKAAEWSLKAAEAGVSWAHYEYLNILLKQNTKESISKAVTHSQGLYDSGNPDGAGWLGRLYRDGKGVERDYEKAVKYMKEAADNGVSWAKIEYDSMQKQS